MVSSPPVAAPVPVALFAYRRHEGLTRTLQCLRDGNIDALYVFSDGPADASAQADVARVRELVAAIDWIEPVVIASNGNLGLTTSIRDGLDWLFQRHEAAIVVEDDVCVAPEFPEYARRALAHYAVDDRVAGVTGLRYPFARTPFAEYAFDVFMSPRFCSWGWATWRDRWQGFDFDLAALRANLAARPDLHSERAGADMPWMIEHAIVNESLGGAWDVVCAANMLLRGQYFVTPTWNMVENTGFVVGTHAGGQPKWTLAWEVERRPEIERLRFAPAVEDDPVLQAYRQFFAPSRWQAFYAGALRLRRALTP